MPHKLEKPTEGTMAQRERKWESYEQVANYLLDQISSELGLERVEGKQRVHGSSTSTDWEIDGKGAMSGGEGFVIIEARRYTSSKQNQEKLAGLAFRILDSGASEGILVSPMGFQDGAKKVAAAMNIQEVHLSPNSTKTEYMLRFLNRIFVGVSDSVTVTDSIEVAINRHNETP